MKIGDQFMVEGYGIVTYASVCPVPIGGFFEVSSLKGWRGDYRNASPKLSRDKHYWWLPQTYMDNLKFDGIPMIPINRRKINLRPKG